MKRLLYFGDDNSVKLDDEGKRILDKIFNQKCTCIFIVNDEDGNFFPESISRATMRAKGVYVYVDEIQNIILRSHNLMEFKEEDLSLIRMCLQLCTVFLYCGYFRSDKQDKQLFEFCKILNPIDPRISKGYWCIMNSMGNEDSDEYIEIAFKREKKLDRIRFMKMITRQRMSKFYCVLFPDRKRREKVVEVQNMILNSRHECFFSICGSNVIRGEDFLVILKEYIRHVNEGYGRVFRNVVERLFFEGHQASMIEKIRKRYFDKLSKVLLPANENYLIQENEKLVQRVFKSHQVRFNQMDKDKKEELLAEFEVEFKKKLEENDRVVNERCKRLLLKSDSKHIKTLKLYSSVGDFEEDVKNAKKEFLTELNLGRDKMNYLKQFLKIQRIRKMLLGFALENKEKKKKDKMRGMFRIRRESKKMDRNRELRELKKKREEYEIRRKMMMEKEKKKRKGGKEQNDDKSEMKDKEDEEKRRGYFENIRKGKKEEEKAGGSSEEIKEMNLLRAKLVEAQLHGFMVFKSSCLVHNDRFKMFTKRQTLFNYINQMYGLGFSISSLCFFNGNYFVNTRKYFNKKYEESIIVCKSVNLEETVKQLKDTGLVNLKQVIFDGEHWIMVVRNNKVERRRIEIVDLGKVEINAYFEELEKGTMKVSVMAVGDYYFVVGLMKEYDCDYYVYRGTLDKCLEFCQNSKGEKVVRGEDSDVSNIHEYRDTEIPTRLQRSKKVLSFVNVGRMANAFYGSRRTMSIEKKRDVEEKRRIKLWRKELRKLQSKNADQESSESEEEMEEEGEEEEEEEEEGEEDEENSKKKKKKRIGRYKKDLFFASVKEKCYVIPPFVVKIGKLSNIEAIVENNLKKGFVLEKFTA